MLNESSPHCVLSPHLNFLTFVFQSEYRTAACRQQLKEMGVPEVLKKMAAESVERVAAERVLDEDTGDQAVDMGPAASTYFDVVQKLCATHGVPWEGEGDEGATAAEVPDSDALVDQDLEGGRGDVIQRLICMVSNCVCVNLCVRCDVCANVCLLMQNDPLEKNIIFVISKFWGKKYF